MRWLCAGLLLGAMSAACGPPSAVPVSRAEVNVVVQPDGTTLVRERFTVRGHASSALRFQRDVPLERADALLFDSASVDGAEVEPGRPGLPAVHVDEGRDLRVMWMVAPAEGDRVFELGYRANGAVAVRGGRGVVHHAVISSGHGYRIDEAVVRLTVDPRLHLFDGLGVAEAGWTVSRVDGGIAAVRSSVSPGESATFMAEVGIDPTLITEPAWQRHDEWARQLVPAFISGGLFILVIGAGVIWIVRFQYPRRRTGAPPAGEPEERERRTVRSGLRTTGLVSIALSGVLGVVTWLTLSHFGWWPMSLPVGIFVVGAVFLLVAKRIV